MEVTVVCWANNEEGARQPPPMPPKQKVCVAVRRFGEGSGEGGSASMGEGWEVTIRVATFNAVMFSMAPTVSG